MNHLIKKLIFCALVIAASVFRLSAQTQTIRGTVSEAGSGEPAIGAVVMIEGTSRAVITDLEGRYSIEAKSGETLVCSMLGFLNQSAVVADGKVIDFSLTPDTQALSEAVVVGYGTLKKTQLVGAVETLDAEALEGRANSDVTRSLQGQIPGLNIIQTDGKPSHSGNVYIRGNNTSYQSRISATNAESSSHSIGQGGSALVLIDGVEGSLSNVNPDDILSVSVLKDAASASVYGARGAYGVILVTTKAPADDVVKVNYNGSVSVKSRLVKWENELVTDGYTWAQCFVENFLGNDRVPGTTGTYPKDIAGAMDFSPEYMAELGRRAQAGYTDQVGMDNSGKYVYYGNTNWYKLIYRDANTATTHNLSVQGSSKKLSWMVSGRFYSQDSIYKIAKETFNNYNLRSKGKIQILPWLSLENNTSLYIENYHQPTLSSVGSATGNVYEAMERFGTPLALPYNPDGTFSRMAGSNGFMALALVWSARPVSDLTFTLSDLRGPAVIPASAAETGFVRFNPGPDVIDTFPQSLDLQPMNCQPYWVALTVPREIPAGLYEGSLTVRSGALTLAKLRLSLKVDSRVLPEPSAWTGVPFIVPNPWAVARYYHLEEWKTEYTEPWSEKHFGYMKPLMERLASIGVRDIPVFDSDGDASLTDAVRSMTSVLRRSDGVERRFTDVRDAWIAFLRSCGFDGEVVHLSGQLPDGARWYNAWPAEVLLDGRASPEHPGDSYLVYPGNRPSMRWMLLLRDLQQKQK